MLSSYLEQYKYALENHNRPRLESTWDTKKYIVHCTFGVLWSLSSKKKQRIYTYCRKMRYLTCSEKPQFSAFSNKRLSPSLKGECFQQAIDLASNDSRMLHVPIICIHLYVSFSTVKMASCRKITQHHIVCRYQETGL